MNAVDELDNTTQLVFAQNAVGVTVPPEAWRLIKACGAAGVLLVSNAVDAVAMVSMIIQKCFRTYLVCGLYEKNTRLLKTDGDRLPVLSNSSISKIENGFAQYFFQI